MIRLLPLTLAAALVFAPLSVFAGPNEDAFLARLTGVWSGKGKITGSESGDLSCTLTMRQRTEGVNFSVKCDVPEFGKQAFSGIISYNQGEGRYEAKSSGGEVTVGTKSGNAVTFNAKMKGLAVGTSVMTLTSTRISIDTNVKRPGGKGEIKSRLELTKG